MDIISDLLSHIYQNRAYWGLGMAFYVSMGAIVGLAIIQENNIETMIRNAKEESEYQKVGEPVSDLDKPTGLEIPLAMIFWPITVLGGLYVLVVKPMRHPQSSAPE